MSLDAQIILELEYSLQSKLSQLQDPEILDEPTERRSNIIQSFLQLKLSDAEGERIRNFGIKFETILRKVALDNDRLSANISKPAYDEGILRIGSQIFSRAATQLLFTKNEGEYQVAMMKWLLEGRHFSTEKSFDWFAGMLYLCFHERVNEILDLVQSLEVAHILWPLISLQSRMNESGNASLQWNLLVSLESQLEEKLPVVHGAFRRSSLSPLVVRTTKIRFSDIFLSSTHIVG
jgi:hypothetical protein